MAKSQCRVRRNPHGPSRFTGNFFRWICETPEGPIYVYTREEAREAAREYNQVKGA